MNDIIDPIVREEIRKRNAEMVCFQDLQKKIIQQISLEWKSKKEIHNKIENKYFNFEYEILNEYNHAGMRKILFYNGYSGCIHGYSPENIENQIKRILLM